jgi:two-component system CheB/CheR fusion protein
MTHPEDVEKSMGLLRQMLNGDIYHFSMVKRYLHKHGYVVWCCLSTALVRDSNNKPVFFVSHIIPVETLRNLITGPELKRDFDMHHELLNEAPVGICVISKEGVISSINRYLCERLGFLSQELVGKPLLSIVLKDDQEGLRGHITGVLKSADNASYGWNFVRYIGNFLFFGCKSLGFR